MLAMGIRLRPLLVVLCFVASVAWADQAADPGQAADPAAAYITRGRQTEARQRAYHERIAAFHRLLTEALRELAPDLLTRLAPPPPRASGHRVVPRIVADLPPLPPGTMPRVTSFSWRATESRLEQETAAIERLENDLGQTRSGPASAHRASLSTLISNYQSALARRATIDANINYIWLWQRQIAADRPRFDRLTARLDAFVARQAQSKSPVTGGEGPVIGFDPPPFVRFDRLNGEQYILVNLFTDITDDAFVRGFVQAVEGLWYVRQEERVSRVLVLTTVIPPERLYCETTPDACTAPAQGEKIDLKAHVARFPADGAVLTTGADSLQIVDGRGLVVGPHNLSPRTLAHEFGHLLGIPDAYLRGYRDLGADGFEVLELVPDLTDIMSSPGYGSVHARHFDALVAAKEVATNMEAGLNALYQRGDAAEAVRRFRAVLERNPNHYGGTLQLAKALDRQGSSDEAITLWKKMLGWAEAARDSATIESARARLASR